MYHRAIDVDTGTEYVLFIVRTRVPHTEVRLCEPVTDSRAVLGGYSSIVSRRKSLESWGQSPFSADIS